MLRITIIMILYLVHVAAYGQGMGVPENYVLIHEVKGDLDKDGVPEKAVVYNVSAEDDINGADRELVIFKKAGNRWLPWHRSKKVVSNSKGGGMMGDPFGEIEIKSGILIIKHAGGSGLKWADTDKYRYQDKEFELIGHSSFFGTPCEYWQSFDFNISTGKIISKKDFERCNDDHVTVYKKESETFSYKLPKKITIRNRDALQESTRSPKYKHEINL